ncbi:MAG: type IV secretory system conjugative DNA transfer family protein [Clostridia bacterium]|nr:type IV secretory system conjugative DNA transfer family protein [Clostridia bacterium]
MKNVVYDTCLENNRGIFENAKILDIKDPNTGLKYVDLKKPFSLEGGVLVGNYKDDSGKRIGAVSEPGHTLVVGSTGSGKTECFYIPQLEAIARSGDNVSFVVMDMKGQMYREKANFLKKKGFKVYVINGKNPSRSIKYNPLDIIYKSYRRAKIAKALLSKRRENLYFNGVKYKDEESYLLAIDNYIYEQEEICAENISRIVEILIPLEGTKDLTWDYGSREIVKYTIYTMLEDSLIEGSKMDLNSFNLYNLRSIIANRKNDCEDFIDYVKAHDDNSEAHFLLNYIDSKAKQTRDSFLMCTTSKLDRVVNLTMTTMTSKAELDLENIVDTIGKEKVAIFCIADSTNPAAYTLCNMFLLQLITMLQKIGDDEYRGDFHIFADEFCNMVKMDKITDWITTMRSRHVWFHLGIQSYAQLDYKYDNSPQVRETIQGNSKTIFLGSNHFKTVDEFGRSFGENIEVQKNYSVDNNGNIGMSISTVPTRIVKNSDLSSIVLGEGYVKSFGNYGNRSIKTILEPDFNIKEFAHDNAVVEESTKERYNLTPYNINEMEKLLSTGMYKKNIIQVAKNEIEYFEKLFKISKSEKILSQITTLFDLSDPNFVYESMANIIYKKYKFLTPEKREEVKKLLSKEFAEFSGWSDICVSMRRKPDIGILGLINIGVLKDRYFGMELELAIDEGTYNVLRDLVLGKRKAK